LTEKYTNRRKQKVKDIYKWNGRALEGVLFYEIDLISPAKYRLFDRVYFEKIPVGFTTKKKALYINIIM